MKEILKCVLILTSFIHPVTTIFHFQNFSFAHFPSFIRLTLTKLRLKVTTFVNAHYLSFIVCKIKRLMVTYPTVALILSYILILCQVVLNLVRNGS